jgi:hypothetical protein
MEIKRDFDSLKLIYEQPRLHISNHFDAIKNKIDIAFCQNETSNLVDDNEAKRWKLLIDKIETLQTACLDSMPSNEFSSEELKSTMSYLSKKKINDNRLKNLIEETEIRMNKILFLNKTIEYLENIKFRQTDFYDTLTDDSIITDESTSFLLILNDSYLSPEFIKDAFDKLKTFGWHDLIWQPYVTFADLILTSDLLKIILIDRELKIFKGVNLIEIDLKLITHLDLKKHNIISIEMDTFVGLINLKSLNLSNNKISSLDANTFRGPLSLESLNLMNKYSEIYQIDAKAFVDVALSLKELEITVNYLSLPLIRIFHGIANLTKLTLTTTESHVSICVKSLCHENLDKIFQAWNEMRSYAIRHNIVLLDYRKTKKPFELINRNRESECVQIMTLNDEWEKREFVFLKTHLNDDDVLDAEVMEERLNHLRLYEKYLKCEEKNEMEQFFNGFQV